MKEQRWEAVAPLSGAKMPLSQEQMAAFQEAQRRARSGPLKLMPDYSVDLPHWGRDVEPLNLPPHLLDRLAQWQNEFDANFDPSGRWRSNEARDRWSREALRLETELRAALPGNVELEVDFWPLSD